MSVWNTGILILVAHSLGTKMRIRNRHGPLEYISNNGIKFAVG